METPTKRIFIRLLFWVIFFFEPNRFEPAAYDWKVDGLGLQSIQTNQKTASKVCAIGQFCDLWQPVWRKSNANKALNKFTAVTTYCPSSVSYGFQGTSSQPGVFVPLWAGCSTPLILQHLQAWISHTSKSYWCCLISTWCSVIIVAATHEGGNQEMGPRTESCWWSRPQ